jgi:hypothetical protein
MNAAGLPLGANNAPLGDSTTAVAANAGVE